MSAPAGVAMPAAGESPAAPGVPAPAAAPAAAVDAAAAAAPAPVVDAAAAPALRRCDNCGASLEGRYCSSCGQRADPPVHTLGHFLTVAFEDVTHADSRLWGTLRALLFKPGFLTREFLDGRRARYLPPVRLYLVLSVLFFVVLGATGHAPGQTHVTPETATGGAAAAGSANPAPAAPGTSYSALEGDPQQCKQIHYNGRWKSTIEPLLYRSCVQTTQDRGRSLAESFMHGLPRAMFLFLPLLAAVMMLLYWHPRHYYVEHLLFCLHNHAFAFLVVLVAALLSAVLPFAATLIGWITALYIGWYLYRSMRVMYRQGRLRTAVKLGFLSFVYLVAGSLMLAATALYAFVTL